MSAATRYLLYLLTLCIAGFALYAGLAELPAPTRAVEVPVEVAPADAGNDGG